MNKEEILAKSRKENNNKDLYKQDVEKKSAQAGSLILVLLATTLFIIQTVAGKGFNFALYAIMVAYGSADLIVKYIYLKQAKYLVLGIGYLLAAIILVILHIRQILF